MSRTGMTLLELMVAMALLSLLAIGSAAWIETMAGAERTIAPRLRWHEAAEATFDLVGDDLRIGDFGSGAGSSPVEVRDRGFVIRTRTPDGPVEHLYTLEGAEGRLILEVRGSVASRSTTLLNDVAQLGLELDEEIGFAHVFVESTAGDRVERRVRVR